MSEPTIDPGQPVPITVLLVEDNEQNAYLVRYLLEHQGWVVVHAWTGAQALELGPSRPFSLVVLDIQLPDLDGYQLARLLRGLPGLQSAPMVAVTSHALAGDRDRALAAGCDEYLEKPIEPLTFASTLLGVLDRSTGGAHGKHPGQ